MKSKNVGILFLAAAILAAAIHLALGAIIAEPDYAKAVIKPDPNAIRLMKEQREWQNSFILYFGYGGTAVLGILIICASYFEERKIQSVEVKTEMVI